MLIAVLGSSLRRAASRRLPPGELGTLARFTLRTPALSRFRTTLHAASRCCIVLLRRGPACVRAVVARDPKCSIAHWGVAMSGAPNLVGADGRGIWRGRAAIERAAKMPAATARERDYIEALSTYYTTAQEPRVARSANRVWPTTDSGDRAAAYKTAMQNVYARYRETWRRLRSMHWHCSGSATRSRRIQRWRINSMQLTF